MAKVKISDWINENVTDDAVWRQYYIIVRKEEYQSGGKLLIEQTVPPARDATITGKEIKAHLAQSASSLRPAVGALLGVVWTVVFFILGEEIFADLGFMGVVIGPVLGLAMIGLGIHGFLKAKGTSLEMH